MGGGVELAGAKMYKMEGNERRRKGWDREDPNDLGEDGV